MEAGEAGDPLLAHAQVLRSAGVGDDAITSMEASVAAELDAAVDAARGLDAPAIITQFDFVTRPRPVWPEPARPADDAPVFRTMDAVRSALELELADDDRVFVAGIDVGAGGNVFG